MSEKGPVYGVDLPDVLPAGSMKQACPGRDELERVREISNRTVAAYEVLVANWREYERAVAACHRYFDHCERVSLSARGKGCNSAEMAVRQSLKAEARDAVAELRREEVAE